MEVQVYFSNVVTGVNDLKEIVVSHLEKLAKEDAKGVDLRRIKVRGDVLNNKILGYEIVDYSVKDQTQIKTYTQLKEFYMPISRLL
ncbi:hypothetical protein HY837_02935 [archaeon]|nr:hypothetical protein [archaeon]